MLPANALPATCFHEGLVLGLKKAAGVKSALNPRTVGRIAVQPFRERELATLGEKVFRSSTGNNNVGGGLLSSMLPGYGQLKNMQSLRGNQAAVLRSLRGHLRKTAPGSAVRPELAARLEQVARQFKRDRTQGFAQIGAVAEPRLNFTRTTLPMLGGAGAGGSIGMLLGNAAGSQRKAQEMRGQMEQAPILERLKYLFAPAAAAQNFR